VVGGRWEARGDTERMTGHDLDGPDGHETDTTGRGLLIGAAVGVAMVVLMVVVSFRGPYLEDRSRLVNFAVGFMSFVPLLIAQVKIPMWPHNTALQRSFGLAAAVPIVVAFGSIGLGGRYSNRRSYWYENGTEAARAAADARLVGWTVGVVIFVPIMLVVVLVKIVRGFRG
jgi:hypothetical protein